MLGIVMVAVSFLFLVYQRFKVAYDTHVHDVRRGDIKHDSKSRKSSSKMSFPNFFKTFLVFVLMSVVVLCLVDSGKGIRSGMSLDVGPGTSPGNNLSMVQPSIDTVIDQASSSLVKVHHSTTSVFPSHLKSLATCREKVETVENQSQKADDTGRYEFLTLSALATVIAIVLFGLGVTFIKCLYSRMSSLVDILRVSLSSVESLNLFRIDLFSPLLTCNTYFCILKFSTSSGPSFRRSGMVSRLSLIGMFFFNPLLALADTCNLPQGYESYFLQALAEVEDSIDTKVKSGFESIGLGPLGSSLPVSNVLDFKSEVFVKLFGEVQDRASLFNITSDVLNIADTLESNVETLTGGAAKLSLNCDFDEEKKLFSFNAVVMNSDVGKVIEETAEVTLLPAAFPSFDITPTLNLAYNLGVPLQISLQSKRFFIGEVTADLSAKFVAELSKPLDILDDSTITFTGMLDLGASLSYSSITEFAQTGSFTAALNAATDPNGVPNLGIRATDDNIFDAIVRKCIPMI